ncbi:MAG: flagellar protein [Aeromonadaceae bacterium]
MLKSYLGLQQQDLERLGEERSRLRQVLNREEQRAERLHAFCEQLVTEGCPPHPLHWQNHQGMQQQLRVLLAHQSQQATLARLDLQHQETLLRQQFGKVQGLSQILSQREAQAQEKARKAEQKMLDELSVQALLRRR